MGARDGAPDARALLAGSARVRAVVPQIVQAADAGQRVALVGGVVRDLLLGREPTEVDVVVEGDGIAFAERLAASLGAELRAHPAFGTATVTSRPPVDVASSRSEEYATPGALPVVSAASLEQDLLRRDATANAIAAVIAGPDAGTVLDPTGGVRDIEDRALRLIRPDAFEEDATRIVRAARYAARLGLAPDATLEHAARAAAHGGYVPLVGPTRLADALRLVFLEPQPAGALRLLVGWGVLDAIEPGLGVEPVRVERAWALVDDVARDADREALGLGLLASGLAPEAREPWLRSGGIERAALRAALAAADGATLHERIAGADDADVDRLCGRVPIEGVVAAGGAEAERYLGRLRHVALAVDGDDVRRITGLEGPDLGRMLIDLRRAVIDGRAATDREAQLAWLAAPRA